jgi:hypothetical protein
MSGRFFEQSTAAVATIYTIFLLVVIGSILIFG